MKLLLKDLGGPAPAAQARVPKGKSRRLDSALAPTPSRKNKGSPPPDFQQMLTQQFQPLPKPSAAVERVHAAAGPAEKSTTEKRPGSARVSTAAENDAQPALREPERVEFSPPRADKDVASANMPLPALLESRPVSVASQWVTAAAATLTRLAQTAADDVGLRIGVMPHAAHINIEVPGGELSLHLRVRGGVAEVELKGADAEALRASQDALRVALAGQGIALGKFALSPEAPLALVRHPVPAREAKEVRPTAPGRPRNMGAKSASTSNEAPGEPARIHVKA
ncbi:MAG: hypothetical protein K1X64_14520 [Myxococcaceae bacterium]|nr:hypothetical protein [Myxococcaceae bacterium]